MAHGDDFLVESEARQLEWLTLDLQEVYQIKAEVLGSGHGDERATSFEPCDYVDEH